MTAVLLKGPGRPVPDQELPSTLLNYDGNGKETGWG